MCIAWASLLWGSIDGRRGSALVGFVIGGWGSFGIKNAILFLSLVESSQHIVDHLAEIGEGHVTVEVVVVRRWCGGC